MTPIYKKPAKQRRLTFNTKKSFTQKIKDGDILYVCPEMIQNFIVHEWSWSDNLPMFHKIESMEDPITGE